MALRVLAVTALVATSAVPRARRMMVIAEAPAASVALMARHVAKVPAQAMMALGANVASIAKAAVVRPRATATTMIAVRLSVIRTTTKAIRPTRAAPTKKSPQRQFDLSR
jgi:hypothetical protein